MQAHGGTERSLAVLQARLRGSGSVQRSRTPGHLHPSSCPNRPGSGPVHRSAPGAVCAAVQLPPQPLAAPQTSPRGAWSPRFVRKLRPREGRSLPPACTGSHVRTRRRSQLLACQGGAPVGPLPSSPVSLSTLPLSRLLPPLPSLPSCFYLH